MCRDFGLKRMTHNAFEHVQCSGIVFWSVHHGRARACARARVWLCAAQVLPDGPGATGRGSPCADLWDGGLALARIDPPAIRPLFTGFFCRANM